MLGGGSFWFNYIPRSLSKKGIEVVVIYAKEARYNASDDVAIKEDIVEGDIKLYALGCSFKLPKGAVIPRFEDITKALKRESKDADVIYLHYYPPLEMFFSIIKRKCLHSFVPVIAGVHLMPFDSWLSKMYMPIFFHNLAKFEAIHVPNNILRYFINKVVNRYLSVFYIPNGINIKEVELAEKYRWRQRTKFRILFAGRLTREKGIDRLINVVKHVAKSDVSSNVEFIIAGDGPLRNSIISLCNDYKGLVKYVGPLPREVLFRLYDSAHALILPSRVEVAPFVVIEALAFGLPVIANDIPVLHEYIANDFNGYLVRFEKYTEVKGKIEKLFYLWYSNSNQYCILRKVIALACRKMYNLDKVLNDFVSMINMLARKA